MRSDVQRAIRTTDAPLNTSSVRKLLFCGNGFAVYFRATVFRFVLWLVPCLSYGWGFTLTVIKFGFTTVPGILSSIYYFNTIVLKEAMFAERI